MRCVARRVLETETTPTYLYHIANIKAKLPAIGGSVRRHGDRKSLAHIHLRKKEGTLTVLEREGVG